MERKRELFLKKFDEVLAKQSKEKKFGKALTHLMISKETKF